MGQMLTSPPSPMHFSCIFFEKCLGAEYPLGGGGGGEGGEGGEAWFGISLCRFEFLYQTPSSTMCNVLGWISSFRVRIRVCVCMGISVAVEVEGGGGVAYSNCLANALDDFFFQPFLAFPSISLHDVSKGEKGNEPKHP